MLDTTLPRAASAQAVDRYYTRCIPFYREFLGHHWHTGWYRLEGPTGPADALRMERRIAALAGVHAGCQVLDVGCGIGGPACHIAAHTGARVHGVTPNVAQLRLARDHAQEQGLAERVQFSPGDASALPVADQSVDVVLFFESACHFPDRDRFFAECHRVLRPGGRLAGEDWLARDTDPQALALQQAVAAAWAIPCLDTLDGYAAGMRAAGLQQVQAQDLRDAMPLARGFVTGDAERQALQAEAAACADPVRRQIIQALTVLGEAFERGAFTVGAFLAQRPAAGAAARPGP